MTRCLMPVAALPNLLGCSQSDDCCAPRSIGAPCLTARCLRHCPVYPVRPRGGPLRSNRPTRFCPTLSSMLGAGQRDIKTERPDLEPGPLDAGRSCFLKLCQIGHAVLLVGPLDLPELAAFRYRRSALRAIRANARPRHLFCKHPPRSDQIKSGYPVRGPCC